MIEKRVCADCKKKKPLSDYRISKGYHLCHCKNCEYIRKKKSPTYKKTQAEAQKRYRQKYPEKHKAAYKKWYEANKEEQNKKDREYKRANKESLKQKRVQLRKEVLSHYGGVCACCGEYRYEFLSLDHINGNGNEHRRQIKGRKLDQWLKANGFPPGYQVLCHNCNMAKGFYGYCPHHTEKGAK